MTQAVAGKQLALYSELESTGNLTRVSFRLPAEISWDQYEALGRMFGVVHESIKFAIGDWLVQGKQLFGDDVYQAAEALGVAIASLMQYERVAERIELERRVGTLTWSHHRCVVALDPDDQDLWLKRAEASGWSKGELENHLREQREEDGPKTTVREHERKLTYVIEAVADAAEKVWGAAERQTDGTYTVPNEQMETLARSLGELE